MSHSLSHRYRRARANLVGDGERTAHGPRVPAPGGLEVPQLLLLLLRPAVGLSFPTASFGGAAAALVADARLHLQLARQRGQGEGGG